MALSFAGEDREHAQQLADELQIRSVRVFYDYYEQADLWGKDLYQHLQTVYRDQARFCVIFVSKSYAEKLWTRHELKQAQARAFEENNEYILPIRVDDTDLPGLNSTTGYVSWATNDVAYIADLLSTKLGVDPRTALSHPLADAFTTLDMLESHFSSFPNVTGVSIGRRTRSGVPIREWCITITVLRKVPTSGLQSDGIIPVSFSGIPVDIQEQSHT